MIFKNEHTTEELTSTLLPGGHYSIHTKDNRTIAFLPSSDPESEKNALAIRNFNKLIEIAQQAYDRLGDDKRDTITSQYIESVLKDCGTIINK